MKNLFNLKSFVSNPSYLGDDKLWAGSDELIGRDIIYDNEYDGI